MDCVIRTATAADAGALAEARVRQLLDEGGAPRVGAEAEITAYFRRTIAQGTYRAYIAEEGGRLVSTAAVLFQEYPPSLDWNGARRGYVTGVYTVPERRGRGLASALLRRIVRDARAMGLGCLWLLSSREGRGVYGRLGFREERPFGDVYMEWYPGSENPPKEATL